MGFPFSRTSLIFWRAYGQDGLFSSKPIIVVKEIIPEWWANKRKENFVSKIKRLWKESKEKHLILLIN